MDRQKDGRGDMTETSFTSFLPSFTLFFHCLPSFTSFLHSPLSLPSSTSHLHFRPPLSSFLPSLPSSNFLPSLPSFLPSLRKTRPRLAKSGDFFLSLPSFTLFRPPLPSSTFSLHFLPSFLPSFNSNIPVQKQMSVGIFQHKKKGHSGNLGSGRQNQETSALFASGFHAVRPASGGGRKEGGKEDQGEGRKEE